MNIKKGIAGVTLAAILIASIFAAIAPPVSAPSALAALALQKTTIDCATLVENPLASYYVGDTVCYKMVITNPSSTLNWTGNTYDDYPNTTTEPLETGLFLNAGQNKSYYRNYTVTAADVTRGYIVNTFRVSGHDDLGDDCSASVGKNNTILGPEKKPPEFSLTFTGVGCLEVEFNGSASFDPDGTIVNHIWYYGDGQNSGVISGAPTTITHNYSTCGVKTVTLEGYDNDSSYNSTTEPIYVDCGPTASARATPTCFEAGGTLIVFNGSASHADTANTYDPQTIVSYSWTFSDSVPGSSDTTVETSRTVTGNDTIIATLTVTDSLGCEDSTSVSVDQCAGCSLRLYGTFGQGPGDDTVDDPETGLPPENKPYSDPIGPFYPQNNQAPRNDFVTFNPAIMDYNWGYPEILYYECPDYTVQQGKEKVFKRMWYEKAWFNDYDKDGKWDVVLIDGETTMTLGAWLSIPAWMRPAIREWNNNPTINDSNVDIYGPAIMQEFTYMFLDDETMPVMIGDGSSVLIPMAHDPANPHRGLNSFDADGDGIRDPMRVESEQTVGIDIDGDGVLEPMDKDTIKLNGNESVVLRLEDKFMYVGDTIQFFDHRVTLIDVQSTGTESLAIFDVCDNEGGGRQRCTENVVMNINDVQTFYRARPGNPAERPTFYLRLLSADAGSNTAIVEIGRMFGQTYANIGANPYRSQKAFIVDEVFYNVVAIKAEDNCIGAITFRQTLPKLPIQLFGKHLECWAPCEILPEMPPFNMDHEIMADVMREWSDEPPASQQAKIGVKVPRPPLEIDYIYENIEFRYRGELKEIYAEDSPEEWWNIEWFHTQPWQYTEFRLPHDDRYLVTLSWYANESDLVLWGSDSNEPDAYWTGERVNFWYEDCTGPLYIDDSIRLYGTFGEGAGDQTAVDPYTTLAPEIKPYTDPVGPFNPENKQSPVKDFMTFNPAIMVYNQGYPELEFFECPGVIVQIPKEKVFKRMWYEKNWFNDHDSDGEWDVVIEQYNSMTGKWEFEEVMTLAEWNALPEYEKILNQLRLRVWNGPDAPEWKSDADIYGPAINQEFTYMFLDDETMPIMIGDGSSVLIPMAHDALNLYRGLNSFDADGDGVRDAVLVESEQTVGIDIDGDGVLEPMDKDATALNGNENVVLRLENKNIHVADEIQFFDHRVELTDVQSTGTENLAIFDVCDNEGGGSQRCTENVVMNINDVQTFYRGRPGNLAEKPVFYLRLIAADAATDTAVVEVGRMFGQTHANIQANPYRSQKAFMVDEVFYNVVAINAEDNCIGYITFRQMLPKVPINLFGKDLKWWAPAEILPAMPPFNEDHEIIIDLQPGWGAIPTSQQDKIGPLMPCPPLEITWMVEDVEPRFQGELKEIYWETFNETTQELDEFWNEEWFWTKPWQYTAFVMPEGQGLYLMTLAWYAPGSEITIWNNDSNGPASYYTGDRVKFWYDPADNTDIYINRVGDIPEEEVTIADWYNMAGNGGDGIPWISSTEVFNAVMDYLTDSGPFAQGSDPHFDKEDLCDYLLSYIDQEGGFYGEADQISEYYDQPSHGGDGDGLIDPLELEQAILDYLSDSYPFGPGGMFSYSDLLAYLFEGICMPTENRPPIANAGGYYYSDTNEPIQFYGSGTDPDGDAIIEYAWDFNNDWITDSEVQNPTHSWPTNGTYHPTLKVKDERGAWSEWDWCEVQVDDQIVHRGPYYLSIFDNYSIHIFNIDDIGRAYVNGERVAETSFGEGGSGAIDITSNLTLGENIINLTVENLQEGYTYGFEIIHYDSAIGKSDTVWKRACGQAGVESCGDSQQTGIVYDKQITLELEEREFDDFTFVHLTDVHIGYDQTEITFMDKAKAMEQSVERFADAVESINNLNPKPVFILNTGDLVEWNNPNFFKAFNGISESCDVPSYFIPGNHDRRTNELDWSKWEFGDDDLAAYHEYIKKPGPNVEEDNYLIKPDNYTFVYGGYLLIGLDSGKDYNCIGDLTPEGSGLSFEQIYELLHLDEKLKTMPKIIFMHHPAINDENDKIGYPDPVSSIGPGGNDACIANHRSPFSSYCTKNNVQLVLTGHTHWDRIFDADGGGDCRKRPLFIQTRSATKDTEGEWGWGLLHCGVVIFKHGFRVIKVTNDKTYPPMSKETPLYPKKVVKIINGLANLHAYDSQGRHTGVTNSGDVERNIPRSYYTGNYGDTISLVVPQMIILYNTNDDYKFEITPHTISSTYTAGQKELQTTASENESINLTITNQTADSLTTISYYNISITENTTATINLNKTATNYTMEIDINGDNITDETKDPDSVETNYAPASSIISPENNSIFVYGDKIAFNGNGTDSEDGILTNSSLVWTSDINGIIGIGNEFNTSDLSSGMHTITLMVNDSADLVDTNSIKILINAPDLTLNSSDIIFSNPNPAAGEIITINATIRNIWLINATNVTVLFFDGIPEFQISNVTINAIQAGENETINVTWNTTGKMGKHSISVMIDPNDSNEEMNETNNLASKSIVVNEKQTQITFFDTSKGTYPSIMGNHTGTIKPNQTITVDKLYTYPCAGTGGHTKYARIWNNSGLDRFAKWGGYKGDYHNITFNESFVLYKGETYNYTIRTGSYPQLIHEQNYTTLDGSFINCTEFTDANGRKYTNWIPAIRLWCDTK